MDRDGWLINNLWRKQVAERTKDGADSVAADSVTDAISLTIEEYDIEMLEEGGPGRSGTVRSCTERSYAERLRFCDPLVGLFAGVRPG